MARVAPASESFWAMPQAMLRLLARPKTTATLPVRSIMLERIPFRCGCDVKDSSRGGLVLCAGGGRLACGEDDALRVVVAGGSWRRTRQQLRPAFLAL